jgi:hypothetical protein
MLEPSAFFEWQTPTALEVMVAALGERLGRQALLQQGQLFREAFVANRFAAERAAECVRLLRPRTAPTPDFSIRLEGRECWYETTETDRPRRRRGLEYKAEEPALRTVADDAWTDPDAYFGVVRGAATKKAAKVYSKCDGLIIWSNAFPIANEESIDAAWWLRATEPAHAAFLEVWIHHDGAFKQLK